MNRPSAGYRNVVSDALAEYMDLPSYRELVDECRKTGDMAPLRQMNDWLEEVDARVAARKPMQP